MHLVLVDGNEADRANSVEKLFAQHETINVRRSGAAILQADVARVILDPAQTGMRFQLFSVGQVHGVRRNIVDRRPPRGFRHPIPILGGIDGAGGLLGCGRP